MHSIVGRGNGEFLFNGHRGSIWEDGNVQERLGGDGCTDHVNVFNSTELHT